MADDAANFAENGGTADDSASTTPQRVSSSKSRPTVCTACRQSKVRCIGPEGGSCTRCRRLGLNCLRDAGFKRVPKASKLAELERQLQQLVSVVNPAGQASSRTPLYAPTAASYPINSSHTTGAFHHGTSVGSPGSSINGTSEQQQMYLPASSTNLTPGAPNLFSDSPVMNFSGSANARLRTVASRTLETVQLNPFEIDHMFQVFFDHYHPSFPFLDPSKSPDEYYNSSTSLFWVIIGVASRRYRQDMTLLTVFSEWVPGLVWKDISHPPYSLATVQAIVILCTWPFPTSSTWKDPSTTLSSIAVSVAMQVGLHRPMNVQDFSQTKATVNEAELQARVKTWAAANVVSQSLGAVVGQLPNALFDWTIDRACETGNTYTLPDELRFKVIIQRYCHRVMKVLCSNVVDPSGIQSPIDRSSFMISWGNDLFTLENELNTIEFQHRQQLSEMDRLYLAAARLYLYTFYFFDSSMTDARKQGILKAYASAVDFIAALAKADAASEILLYLSYYHLRMLINAGCVVLKVLNSSYAQELPSFESGRMAFNQATLALSRSSVFNNDPGAKVVQHMSQVWHHGLSSKRHAPPELIVKSRFGASLTYDFVWTWRQLFGGVQKAYPNPAEAAEEQVEKPPASPSFGLFQDSSLVNLDFLDEPNWTSSLEGSATLF